MTDTQLCRTVGELVTEQPARARVFEQFRIDYCCGGKIPLEDACAQQGVDAGEVLAALSRCAADQDAESAIDWSARPLDELADHVVETHHAYLRTELPRLAALVHKVATVHGERHPELARVEAVFASLQSELTSHMQKEEVILFPMVRAIARSGSLAGVAHCGSIANPIRVMEMEHDFAGDALSTIRSLTHDHTPPADACNSFRVMLDGLAELERDLHVHIHKENNIMFPRAIAAEQEVARQQGIQV